MQYSTRRHFLFDITIVLKNWLLWRIVTLENVCFHITFHYKTAPFFLSFPFQTKKIKFLMIQSSAFWWTLLSWNISICLFIYRTSWWIRQETFKIRKNYNSVMVSNLKILVTACFNGSRLTWRCCCLKFRNFKLQSN